MIRIFFDRGEPQPIHQQQFVFKTGTVETGQQCSSIRLGRAQAREPEIHAIAIAGKNLSGRALLPNRPSSARVPPSVRAGAGVGSSGAFLSFYGEVPKRSNGAGCKPVGATLRRFESFPLHQSNIRRGSSSIG